MAITYKILGQVAPPANAANTVYTVPAGVSAIVSTINVCNPDTASRVFRIAVVASGAAVAQKNYISYDTPIPSYDSIAITIGITMGSGDYISVLTNSANVSFSVFGTELT